VTSLRTPSEFTIRRGSESDLDRVAGIKVDNWADSYAGLIAPAVLQPFLDPLHQLDELRESTASGEAVFLVAEHAGEVVGFALAYLAQGSEPWLESLHVAREFRGRGAGTLLMRELAAELARGGYRSLRLGVVRGNAGAGRLYERLGATLVAVEPAPWAPGVEHEIYRWADLAGLIAAPYNAARD
jgi:ribosomal protein S18 acetylase RimI-like enzyme